VPAEPVSGERPVDASAGEAVDVRDDVRENQVTGRRSRA